MENGACENGGQGVSRRILLKTSLVSGATLLAGLPASTFANELPSLPANAPDHAVDRFMKSMNCSQAILETYAPSMGLSVETARRVAAAFAGGMGMGSECGAVTGALMVIGLKYGKVKDADPEADGQTFSRVAEFTKEFKAKHIHLGCSQLLGVDMATPEGVKEAEKRGLFTTLCPTLVRSASDILDKLLA